MPGSGISTNPGISVGTGNRSGRSFGVEVAARGNEVLVEPTAVDDFPVVVTKRSGGVDVVDVMSVTDGAWVGCGVDAQAVNISQQATAAIAKARTHDLIMTSTSSVTTAYQR
jgi:hypothetical protein